MSTAPNPLIAPRVDTTQPWSGIFLAEDIEALVQGFKSGDWIDIALGGFAATMDALAVVVDPAGEVAAWVYAYAIEHIKPLSDALEFMYGDPDQITAYAQTWHNVAGAVEKAGFDLQAAVDRETIDWRGANADAYRDHISEQLAAMAALKSAANGLGELVHGAGLLVALARGMARDIIAEGLATLTVRLPLWLAEEGLTVGLATPLVLAQVAALLAKVEARVARLVASVLKTIKRLIPIIRRLGELIKALRTVLGRLARRRASVHSPHTPHGPHTPHQPHEPHAPHVDGSPHTPDEVDQIVEGIVAADTPQPGRVVEEGSRLDKGHFGEQEMGFHYSQEKGWAFLEGPSGAGGHQSNARGPDGVAYRTTSEGALEVHVLDNKTFTTTDRPIGSSTALTKNLEQNLRDLEARANDPRLNDAPRIQELRQSITQAREAVEAGRPLPDNVKLVVTTEGGGKSSGITENLERQGVTFRAPN